MKYINASIELSDELYERLVLIANEIFMTPEEAAAYFIKENIDDWRKICKEGNEIAIREGYLEK